MTPFTDRAGRFSLLKTATLAILAAPALWLAYAYATGGLGPLAVKEAIHETGDWAIRFLIATLALTPAQRIFAWPRLALIRRMTGVGTFAYALAHFTLYIVEQKFNLAVVATEIALRIYLTIGFVTLLGLSALAATSTDAALRRLGRKWKMLHRIAYVLAALGVLHFFMQSKIDASEAALMGGLFILLMAYRGLMALRWPLSVPRLALAAIVSGLLSAAVEVAWYAIATGVDPWRVGAANLNVAMGLRPAVITLIAGLAVALLAWLLPIVRQPALGFRRMA